MNASDAQLVLKMIAELTERVAALEAAVSMHSAADLPVVSEAATLPKQRDPVSGRYLKEA